MTDDTRGFFQKRIAMAPFDFKDKKRIISFDTMSTLGVGPVPVPNDAVVRLGPRGSKILNRTGTTHKDGRPIFSFGEIKIPGVYDEDLDAGWPDPDWHKIVDRAL